MYSLEKYSILRQRPPASVSVIGPFYPLTMAKWSTPIKYSYSVGRGHVLYYLYIHLFYWLSWLAIPCSVKYLYLHYQHKPLQYEIPYLARRNNECLQLYFDLYFTKLCTFFNNMSQFYTKMHFII